MTHEELFLALVPYNYSTMTFEEKEHVFENFKSEAIIKFADANNDGLVSLYEYFYFVLFMQCKFLMKLVHYK